MAYLDTASRIERLKQLGWLDPSVSRPTPQRNEGGPLPVQAWMRQHLHEAREMLLVGALAAGTIIAIASVMLIHL